MAIQIKSDGSFSIEYEGPYLGLDVQEPETLVPDKASPSFNNFMLRNAEIRSRPNFNLLFTFPDVLHGGFYILGVASFLDINGKYHTVLWSKNFMSQYDPTLIPPGFGGAMVAAPGNLQNNPVSYMAFANAIYYTDIAFISGGPPSPGGGGGTPINTPFLGYWDGLAAAPVFTHTFPDASVSQSAAGIALSNSPTVGGSLPGGPTITGPIAIGGGFIGELNNQLILANVTIRDQGAGVIYNFPNLMWWSANGLPLQWDPTVNTSAGFNSFLDVPDQITGLATLGVAGYLFRTNGITQFAPTGSAVTPFQFDHMWASDHGIGNVLPWSISQYGPTCAFVAQDNIYALSVTNASPIGGKARDAIMADIATANGKPYGAIVPIFKNGYVYLTYQLLIPQNTFIRNYVYSFDDKNWAPWDMAVAGPSFPSCAPNVV